MAGLERDVAGTDGLRAVGNGLGKDYQVSPCIFVRGNYLPVPASLLALLERLMAPWQHGAGVFR